ncbi:MAG: DNA modification methylase [Flavobacteriales bacterium]|nr:DNA modification methylase [Flavobacteriales bacterium]
MTNYRNRILGLEYIKTADLTEHPGNWREHPAAQAEALKGVLNEVGIAGALLAYRSQRQGGALVVIDGHLRKDAAPQTWPVLVLDVDDAEADYLLATHDPLAAMATADAGALDALLSSVQSGEAAVQQMLAELAEGAGLYPPQEDPQDAEPKIDRAEDLRVKWGVETGQIWRLSSRTAGREHRLICGDCTDGDVVERVMGGKMAGMVFTDPPFATFASSTGKLEITDFGMIRPFYEKLLDATLPCVERGRALFICCDWRSYPMLFGLGKIDPKNLIVWVHGAMRMGANFRPQHEFILYALNTGFNARFASRIKDYELWKIEDRSIGDVWDIPQAEASPGANRIHISQKPVRLPEFAIIHCSREGEIVGDWFSGSGTVLIAAENTGRVCRGVEISPGYVAVALQRYSDAFGITPELID